MSWNLYPFNNKESPNMKFDYKFLCCTLEINISYVTQRFIFISKFHPRRDLSKVGNIRGLNLWIMYEKSILRKTWTDFCPRRLIIICSERWTVLQERSLSKKCKLRGTYHSQGKVHEYRKVLRQLEVIVLIILSIFCTGVKQFLRTVYRAFAAWDVSVFSVTS